MCFFSCSTMRIMLSYIHAVVNHTFYSLLFIHLILNTTFSRSLSVLFSAAITITNCIITNIESTTNIQLFSLMGIYLSFFFESNIPNWGKITQKTLAFNLIQHKNDKINTLLVKFRLMCWLYLNLFQYQMIVRLLDIFYNRYYE